jgi:hypothetical protein
MGERTMNTWLGLLKWSINYHDGTKPVDASERKPMSEEVPNYFWTSSPAPFSVCTTCAFLLCVCRIANGCKPL